ncbi:MutS-related protein [Flavobacterium beibuense]|uniref:Mismatch repair ATPase (MutS family) n=1 Tax=Flavobacterium beibuense TaxID=657326 RepID=A0A444WGB9_9FLAO|nr:DNA mismatch repair protein [Flavobacterium beibuense]RYJ44845.1 Mismatch repair ATPase (MutS family) [Flavobacterium beibuense]
MDFYTSRLSQFTQELELLKKRYNTISLLRLIAVVCFIFFGWQAIKNSWDMLFNLSSMFICAVAFIILMRKHSQVAKAKTRAIALVEINKNEIAYLKREAIPFPDGGEFVDFHHTYSYDLDMFGNKSLFHNINRTETYRGKVKLASMLLKVLPQQEILQNQEAIKELADKAEWRQEIRALGKVNKDSNILYKKLTDWSKKGLYEIPKWTMLLAYVLPILLAACLLGYIFVREEKLLSYAGYLFIFNLGFLSSRSKLIKAEIADTTELHEIIYNYSLIIEQIENETFKSEKLQQLQKKLLLNNHKAGEQIKVLSELFSRMDTVNNLFVMIAFNGGFLFHLHTLNSLLKWKKQHADAVSEWLEVIAEAEALSSIANLYYNNRDFVFPQLNNEYKISFTNVAHPLLNAQTRVGNDVDFDPKFMILTGSNMSGKSTFLRSLGVNMVLAGIGAPVCAAQANIHPLPVLVSMRLSDSLSDSESYFYAEIKRLKQIMDSLEQEKAFVLLDEILRGTNSDDKRTGTIEVVKKMVARKAIGAIATHDVEVCNTTFEYPEDLRNNCFEAQIINNDLHFDYTLREGICKNKSATFLMEKMGVI